MSGALKNLAILSVSVLVSLLMAEAVARQIFVDAVLFNRFHSVVSYDDFITRRLQPDTRFVHTSRDGVWQFHINSQGFRADRDYSYGKLEGIFRLLIVGDSHTQGMEVGQQETFSHLLDGRSCKGQTLETINAGISGSGTSEQKVFYDAEGSKYSPDAVIVGFFANDFDDNLTGFHTLDNKSVPVISQRTHPADFGTRVLEWHNDVGLLSYLSQSSYLYSTAMNYGWDLGKTLVYGRHLEENVFAKKQSDTETELLKATLTHRLLEQFRVSVEANGTEFFVADIPQVPEESGATSSLEMHELPQDAKWTDNIIALDQLDDQMFVAHGQRHINARAHALMAEAIFKRVCG